MNVTTARRRGFVLLWLAILQLPLRRSSAASALLQRWDGRHRHAGRPDRQRRLPLLREAFSRTRPSDRQGGVRKGDRRARRRFGRRRRAAAGEQGSESGDTGPLLILLRRFATEATRDEARLFCDELAAA